MKKYIFLTTLIRGIGGGHIYTLNKIKYLVSVGYSCEFIHADVLSGNIEIHELAQYANNKDENLQYPPYMYTKNEIEVTLNNIIGIIGDVSNCKEVVIESQTINCALWGELLASRLHAIHFVFLLGELVKTRNQMVEDFWKFKLKRHELYGISPNTIKNLFKDSMSKQIGGNVQLKAKCTNTLSDIKYLNKKSIIQTDYTIGSIGRADKMFIPRALRDIVRYARIHNDKTFCFILIGGATNKRYEKKLLKIVDKIENISIHITGLIYPVPVELVQMPDVFVSTAGSARLSERLGIPTITYDIHDFKPIGILGYTTNNVLNRSRQEPPVDIFNLLDDVLMYKKYTKILKTFTEVVFTYEEHLQALAACSKQRNYFDTSKARLDNVERFYKLLCHVFGNRRIATDILNYLQEMKISLKKIFK